MSSKSSKTKNILMSLLLSLALVAGVFTAVPEKAYAAGSTEIAAGDLIKAGNEGVAGYTGTPLWRVLDKADDGSMLLMSEYLWTGNGTDAAFKPRFINEIGSSGYTKVINDQVVYWRGTDAQIWCDSFEEVVLGNVEGLTVCPTTKKIDEEFVYEQTLYSTGNKEIVFAGTDPMNSVLYQNHLFFLSAEEVVKYLPKPGDRTAGLPGSSGTTQWLLRSSPESPANWASEVKPDGELTSVSANTGRAARPVFWAKFDEGLAFSASTDENGRKVFSIAKDQALEKAKDAAAAQLKSIDISAYSEEDRAAVEDAIAEGLKAIENAESEYAVNKALSAAKSTVGSYKTEEEKIAEDEAAAAEAKAKKVKTVTVNTPVVTAASINKAVKAKGGSQKYVTKIILGSKVKTIKSKAFAKYGKVTVIELRTKKLSKKSVKNSLKSSKVKTVKVKVGKAKANKKYLSKYKKIFTKKNAGRKVKLVR